MKSIAIVLLILFISSCKAQNTLPLYMIGYRESQNYYQDVENDLNKFEGTWLYTNGLTSFKVVLKKRTNILNPHSDFFTDIIVGEFEYIENGNLQVNTLPNIDTNQVINNSIYGTLISRCDACLPGERSLIHLTLFDPLVPMRSMRMSVRHLVENGVTKLKIGLVLNVPALNENESALAQIPTNYLPILEGSFILTKIN